MAIAYQVEVRHPYQQEVPATLMAGFEAFRVDPEWQWVLVHDGRVVAQLLAANAHGMLFILRLTALPEAPQGWLVRMLRQVLREAQGQGCLGYVTFLSDQKPVEVKLMEIVQRSGGMLFPQSGALAAGSIETRY